MQSSILKQAVTFPALTKSWGRECNFHSWVLGACWERFFWRVGWVNQESWINVISTRYFHGVADPANSDLMLQGQGLMEKILYMWSLPELWAYPERNKGMKGTVEHRFAVEIWGTIKIYINCVKMLAMKKCGFVPDPLLLEKYQHLLKTEWALTGAHSTTGPFHSCCWITALKANTRFHSHSHFFKTQHFLPLP